MIFESGMEISDKNICLTGKWIKIMKMRINKMHTRHKRGYKFTDKKQSKRGIAAWILSVISLGGLIAVIACSFQDGGNGSMYLGSAGVSSMFVGVIALFNAIVSLREENSYRFFPYLATVCSFLAGWGMGCTVYSWIFAVNKERNWCEKKIFTRRNGEFI